jgi:hypothetical protein
MAPQITPPPDRFTSLATWPNGEPQTVRDAADSKSGTK